MLHGVLRALSVPYRLVVAVRNRLYSCGLLRVRQVMPQVVSVGNLTTGGTGKTPLVEWICRFYRSEGLAPVILSRGYGRGPEDRSDEVLLYEENLPDVRHYESKDRAAAASAAVAEGKPDVFVLDDGFQHRRLARALDIVLIDAMAPPLTDHLLPAGSLREPPDSLARAGAVVVTRGDLVDRPQLDAMRQYVRQTAPRAAVAVSRFVPRGLRRVPSGSEEVLDVARRVSAGAFCGIGAPQNFRGTLERIGIHVSQWQTFPDHHWYTDDELRAIAAWDVDLLLTTQKDAVRIGRRWTFPTALFAVLGQVQFLSGKEDLQLLLKEAVSQRGLQA